MVEWFLAAAKNLTKTATLRMPAQAGALNAMLIWHPELKMYVAAYMGDTSYPMLILKEHGTVMAADTLKAGADIRGSGTMVSTNRCRQICMVRGDG